MATTITKPEKLVGKRIRRREDPRLITGTATYVDDIKMPGMHHACIVRSPHARGEDQAHRYQGRALERPGVVAVFTGEDIEKWVRCRAAHRCPGCAFRITHAGAGPRLLRRPSGGGGGRDRPVHRARRRRPGRSGLRAAAGGGRSGEGDRRRARRRCIREWPDNVGVHVSPGRRRHRQGVRAKPKWW